MLRIESVRHPAYVPQSVGLSHRASIAAIALLGLALLGVTSMAIRRGAPVTASGEPERAQPFIPSHAAPAVPAVPSRSVTVVSAPAAPLDSNIPIAVAVRSHALLGALVALEEEGDTTETSEGLESIASTGAVAAELTGPGPRASVLADLSERLPRMGDSTMAATIEFPSTGGVREVTLGDKPAALQAEVPGAEVVSAIPAERAPSADGDA